MPVFQNYSSQTARVPHGTSRNVVGGKGSFLKQAKPNVFVYPWTPQQATRAGTIRPELSQPHERSMSFAAPTVNLSSAQAQEAASKLMANSMSNSGCGCGCKGK